MALVDNTSGLYPEVTRIRYPKVGQRNSACRVARYVLLRARRPGWMCRGTREHYIARMQWVEGSQQIVLQQLNRLQNTNRVMLADVSTGQTTTLWTECDEAWVDVHDELQWLDKRQQFTWISERDGWRHVYLMPRRLAGPASRAGPGVTDSPATRYVPRAGDEAHLATPGEMDVMRLLHVDQVGGWMYFTASPDNPTQCYLFRSRLDGTQIDA